METIQSKSIKELLEETVIDEEFYSSHVKPLPTTVIEMNERIHEQACILRGSNVDMRTVKGQSIKELREFLHSQRVGNTPRLRLKVPEP